MKQKMFEELLYELRIQTGLARKQVVEKIEMPNVTEKTIRKWESGLEYPDINVIYKLSELYHISSEELLKSKQLTLEAGMEGIHVVFIKCLSFILGLSIYSTIWIGRILLAIIFVGALYFFSQACLGLSWY